MPDLQHKPIPAQHGLRSGREAVLTFLNSAQKENCPLSVRASAAGEVFTSYILGAEGDRLYIDQLMPAYGDQLLLTGGELDIRMEVSGASFQFCSSYSALAADETGVPYHCISLPEQIEQVDHRSSFRTHVKPADSPVINLQITPRESRPAILVNISATGACLRLKSDHSMLRPRSFIHCEMHLQDFGLLACEAVIRHHQHFLKFNESRLGIEFWRLADSEIRKLQKALMTLQRQDIRSDLTI